jgi:hypothetical protein
MARPKKPIDPDMVEKLASHGRSAEQIGAILDCNHRTIERRFAPVLKKGRLQRDGRLQVKLCQEAMGTPCNTAIAIFLAKNWLGMADRPETVVNMVQHAGPGQIVFNEEIKKKLVDMAVYIRKEALAEQQRLERFGNQPNGSCREKILPAR